MTVDSSAESEPAMLPWRSGRNQLTVPPTFTPSRSPAGDTMLSVADPVLGLIRATVSEAPT